MAHEYRRIGRRRIWQLLCWEDLHINYQRVYSIYHPNGLGVKRVRCRKVLATERLLPLLRDAPNLTLSMVFDMDAFDSGCLIKCLTCVNDFMNECLTITATLGIIGVEAACILHSIALFRGYPAMIRIDQGPEITCRALEQWAFEHNLELRIIQPGRSTQHGFIESYNGRFWDECLNEHCLRMFFMPGKSFMTGGRARTSQELIYRLMTRRQLNSQQAGEMGNMKKNQPSFLIEGCI